MTGTFNKQIFKIRLDFFIRHWHKLGRIIQRFNNADATTIIMELMWNKACETLWQERYEGTSIIGIDDMEGYKAFCEILTIGLNQMNTRIQGIMTADKPATNKLLELNREIAQRAEDLADDIEELFNETSDVAA